jgi:hypothetical protein
VRRRGSPRLLIALAAAFALAAAGPAAGAKKKPASDAASRRKPAGQPQAKPGKAPPKPTKEQAKHTKEKDPKEPPLPAPQGKFAVFTFAGEGGHRIQQQVVSSLRAKGLKVITNLRPVDSAEQYREMALTLNLVAYVDGEFASEGDQASATVYVRSGVTGMRAASTTFAGERRTLAADVGKGLWDRLSPDLARICADAAKPRKAERAPLRIEAGTPIENRPADAGDP